MYAIEIIANMLWDSSISWQVHEIYFLMRHLFHYKLDWPQIELVLLILCYKMR